MGLPGTTSCQVLLWKVSTLLPLMSMHLFDVLLGWVLEWVDTDSNKLNTVTMIGVTGLVDAIPSDVWSSVDGRLQFAALSVGGISGLGKTQASTPPVILTRAVTWMDLDEWHAVTTVTLKNTGSSAINNLFCKYLCSYDCIHVF